MRFITIYCQDLQLIYASDRTLLYGAHVGEVHKCLKRQVSKVSLAPSQVFITNKFRRYT
jgi:hypothetical protein